MHSRYTHIHTRLDIKNMSFNRSKLTLYTVYYNNVGEQVGRIKCVCVVFFFFFFTNIYTHVYCSPVYARCST